VSLNVKKPELVQAADRAAGAIADAGIDVLLDDREERPGVKFKDADLIGLPVRVTIGPRGLESGTAEVKPRRAERAEDVPLADVPARVASLVGPR